MAEDPFKDVDEFITWKEYLEEYLKMTDQPYINLCEYSQTDYPVNYQDYKKICLSFAKSIKYIVSENAFSHNKDSLKEICSYLNYWLNRELRNAKKPNMDAKEFYNKLNAHGLSGNFHINKCHDNIKNIYDPVFADLQYLYKLFSSINLYRTSYSIHHKWDCNAANECFTLYDERVSECDMKDNTSFCKKLKEFHSMYNKTMGTNTCQGVPTSLGPFGKKTEHVANRQGSLTANQETPHDNYYKKLISNAQTPFISSLGVISTFVLFYKFTPIGTYMRQLFKRNKTEFTNMDKENNAYSILNSDYEQKNSETGTYNITYDKH